MLLLVMAFGEARLRVDLPGRANYVDAYYVIAGFLIVVLGEVAALRILLTGNAHGGLQMLPGTGIAFGLAFIVYRFAFETMRDLRKVDGDHPEVRRGELVFVFLLTALLFVAMWLLLTP